MLAHLDRYRAFLPYPPAEVVSAPTGPLAGLRLAVKDLFDVAGYPTGCGNPLKLAASGIKQDHAPVVKRLLDAGAEFCGKTHTDELAWSLYGVNAHFGTPVNPVAPDHIPGGSSSGSAAAVAGHLADIALGTDTGGSVRAPAAFCGLWGIRPTHGRVALDGCMALAPSFDTCGFFARDGETLKLVADVLMDADEAPFSKQRLLLPQDLLAGVSGEGSNLVDLALRRIGTVFGPLERVSVYDGQREALYSAFRNIQASEVLAIHGEWQETMHPPLGPGIAERFAYARSLSSHAVRAAEELRMDFTRQMKELLGPNGIVISPVVHDAPLRLNAGEAAFDSYRHDAMKLLCVAGLAGLPQVVFPLGRANGAPFGLSVIGPRNSDRSLIEVARNISEAVV
ncbi:amidase [Stappia sp. F7233]|uniref:Amidase n=1 Tax=Stappia albiluteola TaxID=2758565 RepID=A0A839AHZ4_9HYPH|nr:amidase [Stappia albiluteola]MBA5779333.1 amidase [Stappia albiluteola]